MRGIELGAAGAITPKWQVWAGYSYMDPKVTSYQSGGTDYSGNQMKFIARQSASLWSTYRLMPELTVGAGAPGLTLEHYQTAFEPMLYGVVLAIVLTLFLKETGPAVQSSARAIRARAS